MTRTTKEEAAARQEKACRYLDSLSIAGAVKKLARTSNISPRQARRYVNAALSERTSDSLSRVKLLEGMAAAIERLELISDSAREAGDAAGETKALKAASDIRAKLYIAHQREDLAHSKITGSVSPF